MSEESIPVSEILQEPSRPWNRDGYLPNVPSGTQILKVGLGDIRLSHPYEDHLFRIVPREGGLVVQRLRGFPPEDPKQSLTVEVDALRATTAKPVSATDAFLSPELSRLYLLDAENAAIHLFRLPLIQGGAFPLESEGVIRIALPPKVTLTQDSRIVVVSRIEEEPERPDPICYVSAPGSHVILKVDALSGAATVDLGTPGRPGKTRPGRAESPIFLQNPSALFFDEPGGLLYWADSGAGTVFAARGRAIQAIASFPTEVTVSSLLVYRLKEHVDEPMMLQKNKAAMAPDWQDEDPALLFAVDSLSCQVYKVRLHHRDRSPQVVFNLAPRSPAEPTALVRLIALPNGDLVVSTNSPWAYHVRHSLGPQAAGFQDSVPDYIS